MRSVLISSVETHCIIPLHMTTFSIFLWEKLFIICLYKIITLYEQRPHTFFVQTHCINSVCMSNVLIFFVYIGQIIVVHISSLLIFV